MSGGLRPLPRCFTSTPMQSDPGMTTGLAPMPPTGGLTHRSQSRMLLPALPPVRHKGLVPDAGFSVISHLQKSKLFREYQQAFETSLGLPLVLRVAGSFRTPLQGSRRMNGFCALMNQSNKTCASCLQLQQRAEAEAVLEAKTLQCFAGLSETVVPVRVGGRVLGYLQTGQVFLKTRGKKQFKVFVRSIHAGKAGRNLRRLESAYLQTPVIPRTQYESVIRLLAIFAEHLASVSNQLLLAEATTESPAITKARSYIAIHQSQQLSLGDVAREVHMSTFYFCKYFKQATNLTFTAYLSLARTESVKQLMLNSHLRVSEAAFAAGFQSLSQFNRVFRRIAGETPTVYRDRLHHLNSKSPRVAVLVHAA